MSDTKEERETTPHTRDDSQHDHHHQHQDQQSKQIRVLEPPPPLFLPPFDFDSVSKRPRYTSAQWKPISSPSSHNQLQQMGVQNPDTSPSSSNPQAQFPSPDTSSSPSLSPIPAHQQEPTTTATKPDSNQQQFRKGKYVSPVWKPHEMLWLARAWRVQYQGDGSGSGSGVEAMAGLGGRGKTRAEKDKEVAEYLKCHGVNRDAKTAGTKWDNMLGEFRKVYEWERGGEKEQVGKSYFRLSPYERKIHRLPASFDEEVFEELSQFMGPRMRPITTTTTTSSLHQYQGSRSLVTSTTNLNFPSDDLNLKALPPPPRYSDRDEYPLSVGRTRQVESYMTMKNPTNALMVGFEPHRTLDVGSSCSKVELRRIGKMRMTWEESVSLWAEEGECHRGRVKVQPSSLLNADELVYFDDSMVACALETFEDGPLEGFSIDSFIPGQQLKVFGRRRSSTSAAFQSTGFNERFPLPISEPSSRWDFHDPTDHYLGCLGVTPTTLPSLFELSWYVQEPPLDELRLPIRKDIYRDLPHGKELFFTTAFSSSNEPLDCKSFTIEVLSSLIRPIPSISASTSTSRDSYIGLWDDCINRVISKFCPLKMAFVRKLSTSSDPESLQDEWPNVTGMVENLCLWRGEEIDRLRESHPFDPSSTITQKIAWTYNDLPYVLGYYAVGYKITFCALSLSSSQSITRTDLHSIDLSNPTDRLKVLVPCWRIGLLLATLAEKSNHNNAQSDFKRHDQGSGEIVEMTPTTVTKYYPSKRKWQAVKEVYEVLNQRVPHSEHLVFANEKELALVFKPRGVRVKPKSIEQLVLALKQVTKALVALHDLSFMHRDLSWDKVMMTMKSSREKEEEEEWFLAGFEEAVAAPQINPAMLLHAEGEGDDLGRVQKYAPEMGRGVHGVKVDVWGVGYLVKTSGVKITSTMAAGKQLRELEGKCMEVGPEQRPTAADCYHHLLQIQSSLSSAAIAAAKGSSY